MIIVSSVRNHFIRKTLLSMLNFRYEKICKLISTLNQNVVYFNSKGKIVIQYINKMGIEK